MPADFPHRIAVVGASLAGAHATHTLRKLGYDGEIVVIGAEKHLPYDRPPLSKTLLSGDRREEDLRLRFFRREDVTIHLGTRATSLQPATRTLGLADGTSQQFEGIVIATGSAPIQLDDERFPGALYLRTVEDAARLQDRLGAGRRIVVIGAGLIGCEVASTARALGAGVTLVDPLQPCQRSVGPDIAAVLLRMHTSHGVDIRAGVSALGLERHRDGVTVRLSDQTAVDGETVLIAIGARPETTWLNGSGLILRDGVVCDESCLAAPGIVAAGDVARWQHHRGQDGYIRLEHWNNAVEQGRHAAGTLLDFLAGQPPVPYRPFPWFWSEQHGHKIQVAGWLSPNCTVDVIDGDPELFRFFAHYRRDGQTVGAVGFDSAKRFNSWLAEPDLETV